ncbi:MAG: metallophosphoesterase [Rickettsiales bacterium]|nr:metallophosphoesterase [Rickettsiales bacterium]
MNILPTTSSHHILVISDLHIGALYSSGDQAWSKQLKPLLNTGTFDQCILNGDNFEFQQPYSSPADVLITAKNWLSDILKEYPNIEFHYILGNHERFVEFEKLLSSLETQYPNLHIHPSHYRVGDSLFLHGDWHMEPDIQIRKPISYNDNQPSQVEKIVQAAFNIALPATGASWLRFPVNKKINEIRETLSEDNLLSGVSHIFFGHIHTPFIGYQPPDETEKAQITFHNTGAAVNADILNILGVTINDGYCTEVESLTMPRTFAKLVNTKTPYTVKPNAGTAL